MENNQSTTVEKIDLRDTIVAELKRQERSMSWLERNSTLTYTMIYPCLVEKRVKLNQDKLDAINKALGTYYTLDAE